MWEWLANADIITATSPLAQVASQKLSCISFSLIQLEVTGKLQRCWQRTEEGSFGSLSEQGMIQPQIGSTLLHSGFESLFHYDPLTGWYTA